MRVSADLKTRVKEGRASRSLRLRALVATAVASVVIATLGLLVAAPLGWPGTSPGWRTAAAVSCVALFSPILYAVMRDTIGRLDDLKREAAR